MKCNVFPAIIAVVIACLLAYLAYTIAEGNENDAMCGIVSFACFASTLVPALALRTESSRLNVNIRIAAVTFFFAVFASNVAFAATAIAMPYYIIVHGLLLTIFAATMYKFFNIKDI